MVQDYWNQFETKILQIVDDVAPMNTFKKHLQQKCNSRFHQEKNQPKEKTNQVK
jgi:hypothetical protein